MAREGVNPCLRRWKRNVQDIEGEVLCGEIPLFIRKSFQNLPILVSQFTLFASTKKGTKPDFHGAASPEHAKVLYQLFVEKVGQGYHAHRVKDGVFQAMSKSVSDHVNVQH